MNILHYHWDNCFCCLVFTLILLDHIISITNINSMACVRFWSKLSVFLCFFCLVIKVPNWCSCLQALVLLGNFSLVIYFLLSLHNHKDWNWSDELTLKKSSSHHLFRKSVLWDNLAWPFYLTTSR